MAGLAASWVCPRSFSSNEWFALARPWSHARDRDKGSGLGMPTVCFGVCPLPVAARPGAGTCCRHEWQGVNFPASDNQRTHPLATLTFIRPCISLATPVADSWLSAAPLTLLTPLQLG